MRQAIGELVKASLEVLEALDRVAVRRFTADAVPQADSDVPWEPMARAFDDRIEAICGA